MSASQRAALPAWTPGGGGRAGGHAAVTAIASTVDLVYRPAAPHLSGGVPTPLPPAPPFDAVAALHPLASAASASASAASFAAPSLGAPAPHRPRPQSGAARRPPTGGARSSLGGQRGPHRAPRSGRRRPAARRAT